MPNSRDSHNSQEITEIVVESTVSTRQYLFDLWQYREVFLLLSIKDILMRYRQAFLGIGWALLRPLLVLLFFVIIFGRIHGQSTTVPYYLLVLCAAPVWILFTSTVQNSISSIVKNSNLISKVYFPKLILVGATIATNLVDFLVGIGLAILCAVFEGSLHLYNLLFLPLVLISLILCVLAWSISVAAVNTRYRDVVNIVPFLLQLLILISPIGYTVVDDSLLTRLFFYLNPLTGIIEAMRYTLLDYYSPGVFWALFFSTFQSSVVLFLAFVYFRKIEDSMSDVI